MFTVLGTAHHLDLHNCAVSEESTILTGCVDFDTSMNIRYGGIREINADS